MLVPSFQSFPLRHFQFTFQVKANVISACQGRQVSYPFFVAFINLLSNIELIKKVYLNATNGSRTLEVTKGKGINIKLYFRVAGTVDKILKH